MRTRHLIIGSALTTAAVVAGTVTPAYAAPFAARSHLSLTYATGEKATPVARRATLVCGPAGGRVHNPRQACTELGAANGDPTRLVPAQTACTMDYTPVTVTAVGRWRGAKVRYSHTFGNACELRADTGSVFDF